ncbi:MAG: hypothetical protein K2N30_04285 [Clostridia bacterium]|nr:hypothetical protein [Clostridia bacterium]
MARKRMISPEIWESQSFSALSDLAKIVFISLFSHADDEGRGRADPTYIKSSTFPYDKGRRVADIKSALSEIARSMSVQFYSVNGIEFYFMTSWERWQKIDKPSKSKLPPPPSVGEGGAIHSNEKFGEGSANIRRGFDEGSTPNGIERNRIEKNIPPSACTRENDFEHKFKAFCNKWGIQDNNFYSPLLADLDFEKLDKAYAESSTFLQDREKAPFAGTLSWIIKNAEDIYVGKFKDKANAKSSRNQKTHDILKNVFEHFKAEEGDGAID